jgi:transcriptional regulator with XRE-family HTH domain
VATRERARDRGRRLGFKALGVIADELRVARVTSGTSRRELGGLVGVSRTTEARYETGRFEAATIIGAAELLAAAGVGLTVSTFPLGDPPRDFKHAAIVRELLAHVAEPLSWRTEVPLPNAGDARSWDALIRGTGRRTGIEVIRVLGDVQATSRRIALKRRDGGVDHLLVVLADTRSNRRTLAEWDTFLPELPRLGKAFVLRELSEGRHPGDGIVLFRPPAGVLHARRA